MPGKKSPREIETERLQREKDKEEYYKNLFAKTDLAIRLNATAEDREAYYEELEKLFSGEITLADCNDFTIANDNANIVAFLRNLADNNASAARATINTVSTKRKLKNRREMNSVFKMLLAIHKNNAEKSKELLETINKDFENRDFLKYSCMCHIRNAFYATQTDTAQKPSEAGDE